MIIVGVAEYNYYSTNCYVHYSTIIMNIIFSSYNTRKSSL